jgi:hypothetical protein
MLYWIIDIIADRNFEAIARLVMVTVLLVIAALLGWRFIAF